MAISEKPPVLLGTEKLFSVKVKQLDDATGRRLSLYCNWSQTLRLLSASKAKSFTLKIMLFSYLLPLVKEVLHVITVIYLETVL